MESYRRNRPQRPWPTADRGATTGQVPPLCLSPRIDLEHGARFGDRRGSVETEYGEQGSVDTPLLFRREMAGKLAKALDVDGTYLLNEHTSGRATDLDLGPERRRLGARRRGGYQHDRASEEGI